MQCLELNYKNKYLFIYSDNFEIKKLNLLHTFHVYLSLKCKIKCTL